MIDARVLDGAAQPFAWRNLLIYAMMALTLIAMFGIASRMAVLRNEMGLIDALPHDDVRRAEFNRLHKWSTRVEGAVMLLGVVLIYVTARRME
jgi:hypothetical protein